MEQVQQTVTLFLAGDVMIGRGIDQILQHPGDPTLHERYVRSAEGYVRLAEAANGPMPRRVSHDYVWGSALTEIRDRAPHLRVINLETAITSSSSYWPNKGIHYRVHPGNTGSLAAAGIDCCCLANNHVLDWGYEGLEETLSSLERRQIGFAGAGRNLDEARRPAVFRLSAEVRVHIFAMGSPSSGIPSDWQASETRPGINLVSEFHADDKQPIASLCEQLSPRPGLNLVSIHWGENWGFDVPPEQRSFAHALIDFGIDVVFGHSSHHVKGIEIYRGKPVVYGAGDLLTDYEGITGREEFRGDLGMMYFVTLDPQTGRLLEMELVPTQVKRFQLVRPTQADQDWLAKVLCREGKAFGTSVAPKVGSFRLRWT